MAKQETIQAYYALKAYNDVAKPMFRQDLIDKLNEDPDSNPFKTPVPETLESIVMGLLRNGCLSRDDSARLVITESGKEHLSVLGNLIKRGPLVFS